MVQTLASTLVGALLQFGALTGSPLGKLLVALVIIAVVILVGRVVLSIAWKLVLIAAIVVGGLWLLTTFIGL